MAETPSVGNTAQAGEKHANLFLELEVQCSIQLSYKRDMRPGPEATLYLSARRLGLFSHLLP